jgi:ribosome-associated protein
LQKVSSEQPAGTPRRKTGTARARPRSARQKALLIASALAGKKALRPVILDLRKLTLIADYFVICHATSEVHARALAEALGEELKVQGLSRGSAQGLGDSRWILFDLGDVIVHIFAEFERGFYDLERLWGDAPTVEVR